MVALAVNFWILVDARERRKKLTRKRIISSKEPICWLKIRLGYLSARAWLDFDCLFLQAMIIVEAIYVSARIVLMSISFNFVADHMCKCPKSGEYIFITHQMTRTPHSTHWLRLIVEWRNQNCVYLVQCFSFTCRSTCHIGLNANSNENWILRDWHCAFQWYIGIVRAQQSIPLAAFFPKFLFLLHSRRTHCCQLNKKPKNDERIQSLTLNTAQTQLPTIHALGNNFLLLLLFVYTHTH